MTLPSSPTPEAAHRRTVRKWLLAGIGVLAAVVIVLLIRPQPRKQQLQPTPDPFPITPFSDSPFLNTKPDAQYVGSSACLTCHEDKHASFRHTGMGRSMAVVNAANEPPDAVFDHPASKRRYQIYRKDGELWHRELLLTAGTEEVVLSEYPMKYVVGSGRHARTFLVETDGFLTESPVTWYPSRKAWDMSPGYDVPNHQGFERAVGEACLFCHAGRSEVVGPSLHRMRITEDAIGCERCHGPGSLHVELQTERRRLGKALTGEIDYTIVNPAHLSRELSEAVCQQCHLNSAAIVPHRGRKLSDFRPGLPWQDVCQVYTPDDKDHAMTVVGHIEQMHLSRCFQASRSLTCLTCHDPHSEPAAADGKAYYNAICQNCHKPERCTVDQSRRAQESPDNNCLQCHMPHSDTDIPHLSFTHHRIGIHDRKADAPTVMAAKLKPFLDVTRMSAIDRELSFGLGYQMAALREKDGRKAALYRKEALQLLSGVHGAGLHDPHLDGALAQLSFDMKAGDPLEFAELALAQPDLAGQSRAYALSARAQIAAGRGDYDEALADLHELTRLRRLSTDYLLIANYTHAVGDETTSLAALKEAVRIDPRLWKVHRFLADHYRKQGDAKRAEWHERRAVP